MSDELTKKHMKVSQTQIKTQSSLGIKASVAALVFIGIGSASIIAGLFAALSAGRIIQDPSTLGTAYLVGGPCIENVTQRFATANDYLWKSNRELQRQPLAFCSRQPVDVNDEKDTSDTTYYQVTEEPTAPQISLVVQVTDAETRTFLPGAVVTVRKNGEVYANRLTSGSDGSASIVLDGTISQFAVSVTKDGYQEVGRLLQNSQVNGQNQVVSSFSLQPEAEPVVAYEEASLLVKVEEILDFSDITDPDQSIDRGPVTNALVVLTSRETGQRYSTRSDEQGYAVFDEEFPVGYYILDAQSENHFLYRKEKFEINNNYNYENDLGEIVSDQTIVTTPLERGPAVVQPAQFAPNTATQTPVLPPAVSYVSPGATFTFNIHGYNFTPSTYVWVDGWFMNDNQYVQVNHYSENHIELVFNNVGDAFYSLFPDAQGGEALDHEITLYNPTTPPTLTPDLIAGHQSTVRVAGLGNPYDFFIPGPDIPDNVDEARKALKKRDECPSLEDRKHEVMDTACRGVQGNQVQGNNEYLAYGYYLQYTQFGDSCQYTGYRQIKESRGCHRQTVYDQLEDDGEYVYDSNGNPIFESRKVLQPYTWKYNEFIKNDSYNWLPIIGCSVGGALACNILDIPGIIGLPSPCSIVCSLVLNQVFGVHFYPSKEYTSSIERDMDSCFYRDQYDLQQEVWYEEAYKRSVDGSQQTIVDHLKDQPADYDPLTDPEWGTSANHYEFIKTEVIKYDEYNERKESKENIAGHCRTTYRYIRNKDKTRVVRRNLEGEITADYQNNTDNRYKRDTNYEECSGYYFDEPVEYAFITKDRGEYDDYENSDYDWQCTIRSRYDESECPYLIKDGYPKASPDGCHF